ncbi:acyltransferase family protein [Actinomadura sp. HBU206391]|uniref:acyltransferase family protein n=1 Tax=Actinomadura sp. HBU206391 TaxID=2731692 RepID=UPI00164F9AC5|nr:acyltransferase family protein [Actinomadura sp. HBU206391]MBC6462610.1 acyltransferase family protein [Actinomadura sp. HBU206391]
MPVPAEASPPPSVRERSSDRAPPRPRDPYFDNAKFLAVVLVVIGHAWGPLEGLRPSDTAHLFVYTFHMPLFIVIAGHFSRSFAVKRGKVRALMTGVAVPYLLFAAAYPLYVSMLGGAAFVWSPLSPYYLTWFLLALLMWRLSTPLWQQLRLPLVIAVVISLVSAVVRLPDPVVTRTLGFLPFFVGGLLLTEDHFRLLRTRPARIAAVLVAGAATVTAALAEPHVNPEWIHYRHPGDQLGLSFLASFGVRAAVLMCGLVMTAAFLALVPARRTWFTELGAASMYVYLLHGFVILGATYAGWYTRVRELGAVGGLAVVTVLGVMLVFATGSRPARRAFRWAVEPRLDWAFRH